METLWGEGSSGQSISVPSWEDLAPNDSESSGSISSVLYTLPKRIPAIRARS
ncbi:hypothetical protein FIBSPDRAFT_870212 [Athelia psychrophila]|uniref:Uncharacterized protein n=1 Tax=Athelia psychrophila TaxID=1759441 RepID=A0A166BA09_9AGAM|nr:hypothetical protein FIBSPDRAFT_870212 [Fibularhizoctonia sp. CBS 109695]